MSRRQVVRRMGSNNTHLATVKASSAATFAGATYVKPDPSTRAYCGVSITDGVVMRPGAKVKCNSCMYAAMMMDKEAPDEDE